MAHRVLLLMPTTTYKAEDFLAAAARLGVEVVVGSERRQALEDAAPGGTLAVSFVRPEQSVTRILELHERTPLAAVVGVDDETVVLAAMAGAALGLPHNTVESAWAARDKHRMRTQFAEAGLRGPGFRKLPVDAPVAEFSKTIRYPCVVKPLSLSASRGVLRADDPAQLAQAFARVGAILRDPELRARGGDLDHLLVEDFIPGDEVAVEGLLDRGELRVLALFDKPDPLDGPTFEETLYVTPSRLTTDVQAAIGREVAAGCRALGLHEGPVHAELRLPGGVPWLIELAARTIGGLCARALRFGTGVSLEELVLCHALGQDVAGLIREEQSSGVMMIPIPRAGTFRAVEGVEAARRVPGVEELTISLHAGARLVPLPEGHHYLGFIFARCESAADVERALRRAHEQLWFVIDGSDGDPQAPSQP